MKGVSAMAITKRSVIRLCLLLTGALLIISYLYAQVPVYLIGLPEEINYIDDLEVSEVTFYGMALPKNKPPYIRYDIRKVDSAVDTTLTAVLDKLYTGKHFRSESIRLIGYVEDTLYVLVTWNEWGSEPYGYGRNDLTEWQGIWYNCLTLTLTSIPGINRVQYVVESNNRTGMMWRELTEAKDRESLFEYPWVSIVIED